MKTQKSTNRRGQNRRLEKPYGLLLLLLLSGCRPLLPSEAQPAGGQRGGSRPERNNDGPVAVKTLLVKSGSLTAGVAYTGTSRPVHQVALRSQIAGDVIGLTVEAGDPVARGTIVAQLDGNLQTTDVGEADAELAARRAELAQAEVSVTDAQAAVIQAQATFEQAQVDADRLRRLADQGGISQQEAEAAELLAVTAQQAMRSAQAQVEARRQAAQAVNRRIEAQQAVVSQTQKQLSYADLRSPLTGTVLSRQVDIGDYVDAGDTLLELGDLSTVEVTVQVSDRDLAQLTLGQLAQVEFDAFPEEGETTGRITQIAPTADVTSRLVPIEVTLPNPNNKVGSGLFARVRFISGQGGQVVVPASALQIGDSSPGDMGNTVFVVEGEGTQAAAVARSVRVGNRAGDQIEILSGLSAGDAVVVESDRPLTPRQAVRLSILSESVSEPMSAPMSKPISEPVSESAADSPNNPPSPNTNAQETP